MTVRTPLLLSFVAGAVFGTAAFWWFEDSPTRSGAVAPGRGSEVETADPVAPRDGPGSSSKLLEACSEQLERATLELARERERVALLSEELEESQIPVRRSRPASRVSPLRRRDRNRVFEAGALQASGFSPEDIDWFRERWERAEREKWDLLEREARGEEAPPGGTESDIERELREDLGDDGYDAVLYATSRNNRVALGRVGNDSVAFRAGLRDGAVVWSYDGDRVFHPREVATLSTTGSLGESVEIVIVTDDGTDRFFVERKPLGAELVGARAEPGRN